MGQGSFGIVRKCLSLVDSKIYAVKSIHLSEKQVYDAQKSEMQEVEILKELKHPNIVEYCGSFTGVDFGNPSCSSQI